MFRRIREILTQLYIKIRCYMCCKSSCQIGREQESENKSN